LFKYSQIKADIENWDLNISTKTKVFLESHFFLNQSIEVNALIEFHLSSKRMVFSRFGERLLGERRFGENIKMPFTCDL
jgi:hypothetical protein